MVKISIPLLLVATFLERGEAAGDEEDVLIQNVGVLSQEAPNATSYQCTFRNLWTKDTHPKNYPKELARWGAPIMWTHTLQFEPWSFGNAVTRGVEKVAEVRMTTTGAAIFLFLAWGLPHFFGLVFPAGPS